MSDERNEMTPQLMDELASAYLDGEANPEGVALVEGDPRLQALVEEQRAVKNLIAAPVEAPAQEVQDEMIAQALAPQSSVVPLESARRRAFGPRTRVILAAAAVVAAIAVAGVALFDRNSGDDDMMANDSAPLAATDGEPSAEADAAAEAPADGPDAQSPDDSMTTEEAEAPPSTPEPEGTSGNTGTNGDMAQVTEAETGSDIEPGEQPGTDPEQAEPTSDDISEGSTLAFDTDDDMVNHVIQVLRETDDQMDGAEPDESIYCPKPSGEELELQFAATVAGEEVEVSAYRTDAGLIILQTSPYSDCEYISHLTIDWGK